jgi:hypothetical protein
MTKYEFKYNPLIPLILKGIQKFANEGSKALVPNMEHPSSKLNKVLRLFYFICENIFVVVIKRMSKF